MPHGRCAVLDCPHEGRLINGVCFACYQWMRSNPGKDPVGRRRRNAAPKDGQCTIVEPDGKECTDVFFGKGMCQRHYERVRDHGDPHTTLQRSTKEIEVEIRAAAVAETDECIIAYGAATRRSVRIDGKQVPLSRAVWIIAEGDPGELHVLHTCNGGSGEHGCINRRHLRLGTHAENMQDKYDAERQARGQMHGMHKLTEHDVREIRRRYIPGRGRQAGNGAHLAAEFGVARSTISQIVNRKSWGWLGD